MIVHKKVTKSGGVTIPRSIRSEAGIMAGSPVEVTSDEDGIHIVKHVPICFSCGTVDGVKPVMGIEICCNCCIKMMEVFTDGNE